MSINDARFDSIVLGGFSKPGEPPGRVVGVLSATNGSCWALSWRSLILAARAWITYICRWKRRKLHTFGDTFGSTAAEPFNRMKSTELESTRFFDGTCSNHDDVMRLAFSLSIAFGFPYEWSMGGNTPNVPVLYRVISGDLRTLCSSHFILWNQRVKWILRENNWHPWNFHTLVVCRPVLGFLPQDRV